MIYRTEHPKPQFMRKNRENLNGIWKIRSQSSVNDWRWSFFFVLKIAKKVKRNAKMMGNIDKNNWKE